MPPPPPALSPNARVHWSARCEVVAAYRMIAKSRAHEQMERGDMRFRVFAVPTFEMGVTLVTPSNKRRDLDNLLAACKPLIDGIVDARLLVDDSSRYLTRITVQRRVEPDAEAHVRVELYEGGGA
jgi:crossover junction endodeoxyribonuclease RusA